MSSPFLQRVKLKNYKSIAGCDVELGRLTLLVGPNGSGKSNFLDALRLVVDALEAPLDHALRHRGGIDDVRRRSTGHPHNFAIELAFTLPEGASGHFAFEVAAQGHGGFVIKRERLEVRPSPLLGVAPASYDVQRGEVVSCSFEHPPRAVADRLYLVNLSGRDEIRPVYDAFTSMGFYNIDPVQIRNVQPPDPGGILTRDGRNLASVIWRLANEDAQATAVVEAYLQKVVPGIRSVERVQVTNRETLEFRQAVKGSQHPWKFYANSMSDGTLRALGILVALFQRGQGHAAKVPLVGLEEPETALHPAAAGVLLEALRTASEDTQVIATTHSPQLLDDEELSDDEILAVRAMEGVTTIGRLGPAERETLRTRLFTAGELLVQDGLTPDEACLHKADQLELFEGWNQS